MPVRYRVLEPAAVRNESLGIVLVNHLGSSPSEDAGRDAAHLADHFGVQVVAVNRPGSGWRVPNPLLKHKLGRDYAEAMSGLGGKIAKEAGKIGLERVIIAGRSAGGLGALALVLSGQLPAEGVYAAEAVGCFETTFRDGVRIFSDYNQFQAQMLEADPDLIKPEPTDTVGLAKLKRAISLPFHLSQDIYHNHRVWQQPLVPQYAFKIALDMPQVAGLIDFAQYSLVANQRIIYDELGPALSFRRDGEQLVIDQPENTVHSSFDLRSNFADRLGIVVD